MIQSGAQPLDNPSVFDILNLFQACWFLNCRHLLSLVLSAVKGRDNNKVTWINLLPQAQSHLLCQAKNLAPLSYPSALLKRVMFVFLLEVVNNSHPSLVNKFVKSSALHWHHALPLAPSSPPPVLNPALARVSTLALTQGSEVLPVKTLPMDTHMPVTPMAVDLDPPTSPPLPLISLVPSSLSAALTLTLMLGRYECSPFPPLTHEVLASQLVPGPSSQKWTWDSLQAYCASLHALKHQKDCQPPQASPPRTPPTLLPLLSLPSTCSWPKPKSLSPLSPSGPTLPPRTILSSRHIKCLLQVSPSYWFETSSATLQSLTPRLPLPLPITALLKKRKMTLPTNGACGTTQWPLLISIGDALHHHPLLSDHPGLMSASLSFHFPLPLFTHPLCIHTPSFLKMQCYESQIPLISPLDKTLWHAESLPANMSDCSLYRWVTKDNYKNAMKCEGCLG